MRVAAREPLRPRGSTPRSRSPSPGVCWTDDQRQHQERRAATMRKPNRPATSARAPARTGCRASIHADDKAPMRRTADHHARRCAPLLDLLLPPTCPGCGREGADPVRRCAAWLARRLDEPAGVPLGSALATAGRMVQLEWCAAFNGPGAGRLHALKYGGERRLARAAGVAHGRALGARRRRRRHAGATCRSTRRASGSVASTRPRLWRARAARAWACRSSRRCERAKTHGAMHALGRRASGPQRGRRLRGPAGPEPAVRGPLGGARR